MPSAWLIADIDTHSLVRRGEMVGYKPARVMRMYPGSRGSLPYGNGCADCPDCFACPKPDCDWNTDFSELKGKK